MIEHSLPNIQVKISAAAKKICVLRAQHPVMASADLYDPASKESRLQGLRSRVIPFAFQEDKGWKTESARNRAMRFCEEIGKQLWTNYLRGKKFDLDRWSDERIAQCSLGMEGLGLTFAFPHSVPKATLPLFWARGRVTFQECSIDWIPLLPHGDT